MHRPLSCKLDINNVRKFTQKKKKKTKIVRKLLTLDAWRKHSYCGFIRSFLFVELILVFLYIVVIGELRLIMKTVLLWILSRLTIGYSLSIIWTQS